MKPSEVAKNMQSAIDLLTKQREEYLAAHPDASDPVQDEWPQHGEEYFCVTHRVVPFEWESDCIDQGFFETGNCFRTEAEARRHVEALMVQAELRRMPGRCGPPNNYEMKYWIDFDGAHRGFRVYAAGSTGAPLLAVAGVWFESNEAAEHALDTIGQDRLRVWLDDFLQTPMEGGAV